MSWAQHLIEGLQAGERVSFRPVGNSMEPRIFPGQLCTVAPVDPGALKVGDIVLCRVGGGDVLHLIVAIEDSRFLIGSNRGKINGWIEHDAIHGQLVEVED